MPASGSSSSTGASEPFATTAPLSQSERNRYARSARSGQKRSMSARSDVACTNCTDAAIAELREARDVLRREALRVLDAMAQAERPPHVLRRLERVERVAVGLVADRVHGDGEVRLRADAGSAPRAPRAT